ncbi:hypothetical protein PT974_02588 [Cladobotryum mycophilum]|uniref:Peptidyl-tRNA hydrolase n=1 Tax=Cladobotryum mycophilum TaxID=491253 RepID=A0ABR0SZ11_9HYPO
MRFSAAAVVAALPALSAAEQSPLEQYKAQFQQIVGQLVSYIPNPGSFDAAGAEAAKHGPMKLSVLTLENWKDTLYEPVAPEAKTHEEWWVLITGRNKTCFGHCGEIEKAFNETATKFADVPETPHMAILNCEDQPILCNSWSAGAGSRRFNLTTVTTEELLKLQASGTREEFTLLDSWFHPFNGKITELGLSVPFGYTVWVFNLIPQWLFMLIVSLVSRTMMSNRVAKRVDNQQAGAAAAAAAGQKKTK